jgi:hypothetical protein
VGNAGHPDRSGKRIFAAAGRRRDERVLVAIVRWWGDDAARGITQHVFFARPTNLVADRKASNIFGDMMSEEGHSPPQPNAPSPFAYETVNWAIMPESSCSRM